MKKLPDFKFEEKYWEKGFEHVAGVDEVGKGCFAGPVVAGCVVFSKYGTKQTGVLPLVNPKSTQKGPPALGFPNSRHPRTYDLLERQDPSVGVVIDDSKKMTPKQREISAHWIKENALSWGIGEASAGKINKYGMAKASRVAFRKAISDARKRLGKPIDFLLSDAFFTSYVPGLPTLRRKDKKGRFSKKIKGRQEAIINGDEKTFSIAAASIIAKVYRDSQMVRLSKKPVYKQYEWTKNKGYGTKNHRAAILKHGITKQHRKQFVETWQRKLNAD